MSSTTKQILGVDIGGTGVKAAIVDIEKGELASERIKLATPKPSTPDAVLKAVTELKETLKWNGPIGCGFPGLIKENVVKRAPNLDKSWVGFNLIQGLKEYTKEDKIAVGNDADAAGVAEVAFGAGKGQPGTVIMVTLGTGIGTAVFHHGSLLPDTELGHIIIREKDAERWAANSAREKKDWGWKKWSGYVDEYLARLEYLIGADLFIIGGGVSKKHEKFIPHFKEVSCKVVPAQMGNLAGIIGAAMFAAK